MKLLVIQFLASWYFLSGAKYSPHHPVIKQSKSAFLTLDERQRFMPIKETSNIVVPYTSISVFTFFDGRLGFRIY
jgi:hypothetical protein